MQHGQDINHRGKGDQTPLIHAILNNKLKVVKWLIQNGADLTIPESNGYTPMHIAAFAGRPEAIKMLLEAEVDPSEKGKDGWVVPVQSECVYA